MDNKAMRTDMTKDAKSIANGINAGARDLRDTAVKAKDEMETKSTRLLSEAKSYFDSHTPDYIREGLESAQATAKRAFDSSEKVMRQNVWYSVLGAAGVGILVGAFMFRRRH